MPFTYTGRAAERDIGSPAESKPLIRTSQDHTGSGNKVLIVGIELTKIKYLHLTADTDDVIEIKEEDGESFGKFNIGAGAPTILFADKDLRMETVSKGKDVIAVVTTGTNLLGFTIHYNDNN